MKSRSKRGLSLALAMAMGVSMVSSTGFSAVAAPAAGNSDSQAQGEASTLYEPWRHGYRFVDVLNWEPGQDDYSEEMRSYVPLQEYNEAFTATQANPNLTENTSLYAISAGNYRSTDVSEAPWNGNMAYDDFSYNAFKFWQYTDYIGAGGRPTSGVEKGSARKEYGVVTPPIPAYINAAHKNGAKALGEYFVPRNPQYTEEWLYKDENGNFPYAQKLIDIMNYYGFDGYFINQEESIDASYVPLFREMLKWMRDQGCYIQWYDSIVDSGRVSYQNVFNAANSNWIWNETNGRVTDSIFLNYWNDPAGMQGSADHAISLGLDPQEVVFYGVEGGQWRYTKDLDGLLDDTGNSILSFAIWGSDFYREQYDRTNNNRYKSQYQWAAEERERMYFTSSSENAGDYTSVDRPDVGVSNPAFKGFSRYVAEKSVINGSVFTSNFNNGHGMQYFQNGEVTRDMEWTNVNIQDILPTWQWWIESEGAKLDMDWDYGSTYERIVDGSVLPFEYQQIGAYNGGSSLVAYGDLEGENYIHLYKTDLDIGDNSKISFTYNKPSATDSSTMQLALIFKSAPENTVYLPIENAGETTDGWRTVELDLAEYAGEELAAIGVQIDSETAIPDYQVNFGQIKVSDGNSYTPEKPEGFQIDRIFDETGEVQVSWDLADYSEVKQYNIYAGYADGSERFVGGAYAESYYIQNLEDRDNIVSLKLKAVGKDGSESEAAEVAFNDSDIITNIRTVSADNKLNITWDEAEGDYDSVEVKLDYFYSDKEPVSVTVDKGVKSAQLDIPVEDGSEYVLTLSTAAGSANYFGKLEDNYCEPYDGEMRFNANGLMNLTTPAPSDWYSMSLELDGSVQNFYRYNSSAMRNISIPEGNKIAIITLGDNNGNNSIPAIYVDGVAEDLDQEITANVIPDDALRQALIEQAGPTLSEALTYEGSLDVSGLAVTDLTGIDLFDGITSLDLSGTQVSDLSPLRNLDSLKVLNASNTQVEEVTEGMLPTTLEELDLSANAKLTAVQQGAVSELENLKSLNISGNGALKVLYLDEATLSSIDLTGCNAIETLCTSASNIQALDISAMPNLSRLDARNSQLEKITAAEGSSYTNIYRFDIAGSKLDLSEGTPERQLIDELEAYIAENPITPVEAEASNLAPNGTATSDAGNGRYPASNVIDGDMDTTFGSFESGQSVVIDLGSVQTISKWQVDYYPGVNYYIAQDFRLEASEDGVTYQPVDMVTDYGRESYTYSKTFDSSVKGRYFKFVMEDNEGYNTYVNEIALFGEPVEPYGLDYNNQRPAAYTTLPEKVTVTTSQIGSVRTKDYFEDSYKNAETVRGTLFSSLEGADWIAPDYDIAAQIAVPENVSVEITDEAGTVMNPSDTPDYEGVLKLAQTGLYTVNFMKDGAVLDTMQIRVKAVTSVLERVIEKAEQMKADGALDNTMQAVVDEFNAALEEAKALVAKEDATQAQLKDSAVRLLAVMAKVDWKQGDKTILEVAVDVALSINENLDLYEEAGKQEFIDALATAQELLASGNAWQDDIDAATDALIEAMSNLRMTPNKDILNDMINQASGLDLSVYTPDSAAALNAALANAKAVAADDNATQAQIDTAADTLKAAMSGLVFVDGTTGTAGGSTSTTPVGEGTTPTKTGDAGAAGLAALALLSAGALIVLKKKNHRS